MWDCTVVVVVESYFRVVVNAKFRTICAEYGRWKINGTNINTCCRYSVHAICDCNWVDGLF